MSSENNTQPTTGLQPSEIRDYSPNGIKGVEPPQNLKDFQNNNVIVLSGRVSEGKDYDATFLTIKLENSSQSIEVVSYGGFIKAALEDAIQRNAFPFRAYVLTQGKAVYFAPPR